MNKDRKLCGMWIGFAKWVCPAFLLCFFNPLWAQADEGQGHFEFWSGCAEALQNARYEDARVASSRTRLEDIVLDDSNEETVRLLAYGYLVEMAEHHSKLAFDGVFVDKLKIGSQFERMLYRRWELIRLSFKYSSVESIDDFMNVYRALLDESTQAVVFVNPKDVAQGFTPAGEYVYELLTRAVQQNPTYHFELELLVGMAERELGKWHPARVFFEEIPRLVSSPPMLFSTEILRDLVDDLTDH